MTNATTTTTATTDYPYLRRWESIYEGHTAHTVERIVEHARSIGAPENTVYITSNGFVTTDDAAFLNRGLSVVEAIMLTVADIHTATGTRVVTKNDGAGVLVCRNTGCFSGSAEVALDSGETVTYRLRDLRVVEA